jgi:hypothetical protein
MSTESMVETMVAGAVVIKTADVLFGKKNKRKKGKKSTAKKSLLP